MAGDALVAFGPRKTPVQVRGDGHGGGNFRGNYSGFAEPGSGAFDDYASGGSRWRICRNLYQYFPNKRSLLFAVLGDHLEKVTEEVEGACERARRRPLAERIKEVVEAFADAKIARADILVAHYKIAPDVGGLALVKRVTQRMREAIVRMLESAPDGKTSPDEFAVQINGGNVSCDALGAGDGRSPSHDA